MWLVYNAINNTHLEVANSLAAAVKRLSEDTGPFSSPLPLLAPEEEGAGGEGRRGAVATLDWRFWPNIKEEEAGEAVECLKREEEATPLLVVSPDCCGDWLLGLSGRWGEKFPKRDLFDELLEFSVEELQLIWSAEALDDEPEDMIKDRQVNIFEVLFNFFGNILSFARQYLKGEQVRRLCCPRCWNPPLQHLKKKGPPSNCCPRALSQRHHCHLWWNLKRPRNRWEELKKNKRLV